MTITLNIWSKPEAGTRIYFNDADGNAIGFFGRKLARAYSHEANSFTNTVPGDIFAEVSDFVMKSFYGDREVSMDNENLFVALVAHCANETPDGLNVKQRKAKRDAQKARVAAFTEAFGA